jgi:hypothetical protein
MLKLIRLAFITTLPLLLLLAACGGDDDDDGGDSTATATETAGGPTETEDEPTTTDESGDDGGEASEYYQQFADIVNQADQDIDDISSQYGGPYDDAADEIEQTRSAINETGAVVEQVWLDLGDLEPPSEAESDHQSYLEALQGVLQNYAALTAALEDVSDQEGLNAVIDEYSPPIQERNQEVEDICVEIQQLADDAGSGADLGCTD